MVLFAQLFAAACPNPRPRCCRAYIYFLSTANKRNVPSTAAPM